MVLATSATWAMSAFAQDADAEASREPVRVRSLEIRGVESVDEDLLRERVLTSERSKWAPWRARPLYDEFQLEGDLERIQGFYQARGYYEASASSELVWNESRTLVDITIDVVEAEVVRLAQLSISLAPAAKDLFDETTRIALIDDLPLLVGEPFGIERYKAAKAELLRRLADLAHPRATLEGSAEVDLQTHEAQVQWALHPGPRVVLGEIELLGVEKVDPWIIEKEIPFAEGDLYSVDILERSQRAVYDQGVFSSVSIRALPPDPEPDLEASKLDPAAVASEPEVWPVEVHVKERSRHTVRLGIGYGTEDEFRVKGTWRQRNLFGEAESLEFGARYSSILSGAEIRYHEPFFIRPVTALSTALRFERAIEPAYNANTLATSVHLERPLARFGEGELRLRIGYGFERSTLTAQKVSIPSFSDAPETFLLGYLDSEMWWSSVDNIPDPTRGVLAKISLRPVLKGLGSDDDHLRLTLDLRNYTEWWGVVLALRARLGTVELLRKTQSADVPVVERFFSGGSNSVRGFDYKELGPLDADGDPLGGLSWAEASAELRFPIWWRIGGVVFFDAGQVQLAPHGWRGDGFETSVGTGIRFKTPIGPVGLDVGFPLDPNRGDSGYRIHLSVGHAF